MKEINGVKIEWFEGNAYVRLNQYEKLLQEYKELKERLEKQNEGKQ